VTEISDVRDEPSGDVSIAEGDGFSATFDGASDFVRARSGRSHPQARHRDPVGVHSGG
jgi:hypothetical protein